MEIIMNKIYGKAISEIFNLKKRKRVGWMLPGRNLEECQVESVADHTWGVCMVAEIFLPSTKEEMIKIEGEEPGIEEYDKEKILRMLLVHDLSEAYTGDIALGYKTDNDRKKEEDRMAYYATLAQLSPFENLGEIYKRWEEYEERKQYNAKLAKDIDQLECYIQLFMYKELLISKNGIQEWTKIEEGWFENLKLKTKFGVWLCNFIKENFHE